MPELSSNNYSLALSVAQKVAQAQGASPRGLLFPAVRTDDRVLPTAQSAAEPILVRDDEHNRQIINDFRSLYVRTSNGDQIPLKSVAIIEQSRVPDLAVHHDGPKHVVGGVFIALFLAHASFFTVSLLTFRSFTPPSTIAFACYTARL